MKKKPATTQSPKSALKPKKRIPAGQINQLHEGGSDCDSKDIGIRARVAALKLMEKALSTRSGLDEGLMAKEFLTLSPDERSFARALCMLGLRQIGFIDTIIKKRTKGLNDEVVGLLRLGLIQMKAMHVPDFAAVSTTVKLAERSDATRPFKGLINAVLRGVARDKDLLKPQEETLLPDWLGARYESQYGQLSRLGIARALLIEPKTDLSFISPYDCKAFSSETSSLRLWDKGLRSELKGDIVQWPHYEKGIWWVQDISAQLAVALMGNIRGQSVIDMCAAPGGKALQLLAGGAEVTALDRSKTRLSRLNENIDRLRLALPLESLSVSTLCVDAESYQSTEHFDGVLLDAPCSATGTFRRQPEVLWATTPLDIARLADLQHRLLDKAASLVKLGGWLLYCTCSLEREEGETQILGFLRRHKDFSLETPNEAILAQFGVTLTSDHPWIRLLPHEREGGQDGFFIALLRRIKPSS